MLKGILGNATAENVLLYLEQYEEGYPTGIADNFERVALSQVQRQLERLEAGGLLVSQLKGRTRLFTWNPRYAFLDEIRALLRKALRSLPKDERRRYFGGRRRPRRRVSRSKRPDRADGPRQHQTVLSPHAAEKPRASGSGT